MTNQVLIVEDDEDVREMFAEVLRDAGYSVREASNGQEGLEALERFATPCLVLLDMMMPVMSGPELLSTIKGCARLAPLPVVVLSAGGSPTQVPQANAFFRKPVHPDELLEVVARYCDGS